MIDYFNPPNSIWPNGMKVDSDGYAAFYPLGTNKVNVPTGSAQWPKGDKLISPFVYDENYKLVGFVDTKALTTDSQTTIYLPYTHIEADFSSIEKGQLQIHAPKATTKKASWKNSGVEDIAEVQFKYKGYKTTDQIKSDFGYDYMADIANGTWSEPLWDLEDGNRLLMNADLANFASELPSLTNGEYMFFNCILTTFDKDLSSLTNGEGMFSSCTNLTSFNSDLPNLTNGYQMFLGCDNLSSFNTDLSSLTNGYSMFRECSNLTSFTSDLHSLTDGEDMFSNCSNLTSFSSDLSSLTTGWNMFDNCTTLTTFSSDLPSLTMGYEMFHYCKLNAPSVKNIIDTIKTVSSATLTLGMGCDDTEADKDLFAQEVGYADMTALLATLKTKGWNTYAQYNGRPTTTYGLRRPTEDTLPVFVKLEETEEHADYTSLDVSKKYRLNWFHETTGSTDGYTQFNSLEEAIETLNIKPIEK